MDTLARSVGRGSKFASRAAAGFGLVTAITALTSMGTAMYTRDEAAKRERILEAYADDVAQAARAQLAAEKMVAIGRGYLLVAEPDFLDRLGAAEDELDAALQALERPGLSRRERELLGDARIAAGQYRAIFDEIPIAASAEARARKHAIFRDQLMPRRRDVGVRLEQLVAHKRQVEIHAREDARRMAARTFGLVFALSAIALALCALLAWRFIKHLAAIYRHEQEIAAQARRASAAREELLGAVAHDLRNPLGAINMTAASIARQPGDPRAVERAESIRRLAARMEALIGTLLEAARIEAGRLSLAWRRCAVSELFVAAGETFGGLAQTQEVALAFETQPAALACWGDPDRIVQVLSNLIGNALKFTSAGGTVRVRAVESGFHIRFEVRDTGPGIAPHHLPRVFDRFWRAESAGRKGTGLGLYIAKGIVAAHRGRIWVESQVGVGSAFIFEIPTAPPAARDDTAPGDDPARAGDDTGAAQQAAGDGAAS
jgi:signal transduction histidine kinase